MLCVGCSQPMPELNSKSVSILTRYCYLFVEEEIEMDGNGKGINSILMWVKEEQGFELFSLK